MTARTTRGGPRPFRSARQALLAATLLLAAAGVAFACAAWAAGPRTIVVRGQALSPEGRPLAGARVQVRGTASVVALADDHGRFTLSVPLGMPAALRESPFRMEVRADAGGRRLPLAGGGQSLVLDASWQAAKGRVVVKSNREAAAKSVATALEMEAVSIAWVEADFGGAGRPPADGTFTSEATLPGSPPVATPAAADTAAKAVAPAPRDSTRTPAPVAASVPATRDSAPAAPAAASAGVPAPRDSARSTAAAAPPATTPPAAPPAAPRAATLNPTIGDPAKRGAMVRAIAGLAGRDSSARRDSCRCSVRGTVEIDWTRPLEDHTSVRLELDAPGVRPAEISLFMGAPREFRFGPLPCGVWRMTVKAKGKLRYTDARGDSARVIPCAGGVETRVVLVPGRR